MINPSPAEIRMMTRDALSLSLSVLTARRYRARKGNTYPGAAQPLAGYISTLSDRIDEVRRRLASN